MADTTARDALVKARDQFLHYAKSHREKAARFEQEAFNGANPHSSDALAEAALVKAAANDEMAAAMQDAIDIIDQTKVGDGSGDAAIAIGEDAFRAGFTAGNTYATAIHRDMPSEPDVDAAWSAYDPPEHIKALS